MTLTLILTLTSWVLDTFVTWKEYIFQKVKIKNDLLYKNAYYVFDIHTYLNEEVALGTLLLPDHMWIKPST